MALFDSKDKISSICACALSTEVILSIGLHQTLTSLAGEFHSNQQVLPQEIILPDFKCNPNIDRQTCQGPTALCLFKVPLGCDFWCKIHPDFSLITLVFVI